MALPAYMKNAVPVDSGPDYMKNAEPVDTAPDPDIVAHAASDATPAAAAQALSIAGDTGLSPDYVAQDLPGAVKTRAKQEFSSQLAGRPALTAWAAQSTQHAAAVKEAAGPLGMLEGWFSEMGDALKQGLADPIQAEAMREYMGSGGRLASGALQGEADQQAYEKTNPGVAAQILRAAPQMVLYGAATRYLGGVGLAGLLYSQNKGVLARQIQQAQPGPPEVDLDAPLVNGERPLKSPDLRLTDDEIDHYATAGSAASAIALAGLMGPLVRSMPGVSNKLQGVTAGLLSRAAATTVGQAAIRSLAAYGGHTLMGALGMTLQASINSETVKKAADKDFDPEQTAREAADTFLKVLPIAAAFGAWGPGKEFLDERARLNAAPAERAKLDAQVELAREFAQSKDGKGQKLATDLFGALGGAGHSVYIDYKAAKDIPGIPDADVAQAETWQGTVEVSMPEYLAGMQESHADIADDVKLTRDGKTMNEAREDDARMREVLTPDAAKALYGKLKPDELQGLNMPLAGDLSPEMARQLSGKSNTVTYDATPPKTEVATKLARPKSEVTPESVAESDTSLYADRGGDTVETPGLHEVMAREYGGTPEEWAARLTPDLLAQLTEPSEVGPDYKAAAAAIIGKTAIGDINPVQYARAAKKASRDLIKVLVRQVDHLSSAEETAQEGIDVALEGIEKGNRGVKESGKALDTLQEAIDYSERVLKRKPPPQETRTRVTEPTNAETGLYDKGGNQKRPPPKPYDMAADTRDLNRIKEEDATLYERLAQKLKRAGERDYDAAQGKSLAATRQTIWAGELGTRAQELSQARDTAQALADKAASVAEEMGKGLDKLAKQAANEKLRANLNLADPSLLHLFDALTEGTSASPQRKGWLAAHQEAVDAGHAPLSKDAADFADARMASSLDDVKQWFEDMARPVEFDETLLQGLLDKPRPWSELKPAEARNVLDAVRQLTTAAREESIVRSEDGEATVAEAAGEIIPELEKNPDKGLPFESGQIVPWVDKRLLDANAANAVQLRAKNNLRQKSVAAVKWIYDRINNAVYDRDELFRSVGELYKAAVDAIPKDIAARRYETYDLSDKLPVSGVRPLNVQPRQWVWKLARHWGSAGNIDRIVSTTGWDRNVLSGILFDDPQTKLSVPEWDYIQSIGVVNETHIWPKLKDHFEKFYGQAPPKVAAVPFKVRLEDGTWKDYAGGYEPLKRDARPGVAPSAEPTKGIAQYWGRDNQIPWTPGSVKERIDNSHYLVNMNWDASRAAITQTLHWLAFDQPVRDVAKLLNYQPLAAAMNQRMGQARADMTREWLKSSATQQAMSIPKGMEIVGKAFGVQRQLQLAAIVGGSARLAAAQLSHPVGLMLGGEINPIHGLAALVSTFKPLEVANGEVRLFPNWNDALDNSRQVQRRADNAYSSLRDGWDPTGGSKPGPLGALRDIAMKTSGLFLHAVDRLTTTWAWTAAHNEAIAKGAEPFSEEAIAYADGKTEDVMPVHNIESAAPILTNKQVGGFLIMHGFKNTLYNMRQDALAKTVMDWHAPDVSTGSAIARTAGRVALQAAMYGGFAVMGKLTLGYGQQDGENKSQYLARTALAGQTEDLPFVGALGEPLAKWLTGGKLSKQDFTTYGNPGMAAILKVQEELGNVVNGGRENYKKVFDGLETALFMTGLPSRTARVGAEHLYESITGEGFDQESSDAGRYFYSEKQWDSIKRTLTPDED